MKTAIRLLLVSVLLISLLYSTAGCATRSVIADAMSPPYRPDTLYNIEHAYSKRDEVLITFRAFLAYDHPRARTLPARQYWLTFSKTEARIHGCLKLKNESSKEIRSYEHVLHRRCIHKGIPHESVIAGFKKIPVLRRHKDSKYFSGYPDFVITSLPEPGLEAVYSGRSNIGYGLTFHYAEQSDHNGPITDYRVLIKEKKNWTESLRALSGLPFTLVLDAIFLPIELIFLFEGE